ncbi:hypothetical protein U1Q18_025896 [Sarracenia purpurea var. burkii]
MHPKFDGKAPPKRKNLWVVNEREGERNISRGLEGDFENSEGSTCGDIGEKNGGFTRRGWRTRHDARRSEACEGDTLGVGLDGGLRCWCLVALWSSEGGARWWMKVIDVWDAMDGSFVREDRHLGQRR